MQNEIEQKTLDKAVKALISLFRSGEEADSVVREFNPSFDGEETIEMLIKKAVYVQRLFEIDVSNTRIVMPPDASEYDRAVTGYYSLLGVVTSRVGRNIMAARIPSNKNEKRLSLRQKQENYKPYYPEGEGNAK